MPDSPTAPLALYTLDYFIRWQDATGIPQEQVQARCRLAAALDPNDQSPAVLAAAGVPAGALYEILDCHYRVWATPPAPGWLGYQHHSRTDHYRLEVTPPGAPPPSPAEPGAEPRASLYWVVGQILEAGQPPRPRSLLLPAYLATDARRQAAGVLMGQYPLAAVRILGATWYGPRTVWTAEDQTTAYLRLIPAAP